MTHDANEIGGGRARPVGGWSQLPDYSLSDIASVLWRERVAAIATAFLMVIIGAIVVLALIQPRFTATASVLVLQDARYSADPVADQQGRDPFQTQELVQAELAFLRSDEIRRRTLNEVGAHRIYPRVGALGGMSARQIEGAALEAFRRSLWTDNSPSSPTITLNYRHRDADIAASVLNTLLDEYVGYRREVLIDYDQIGFAAERQAAETRLTELNGQIDAFLSENGIGDFAGDRAAAVARAASIEESLLDTRAEVEEARARLGSLAQRIGSLPADITIHVDDAASERMQALILEREDLLSRYRPDSIPVTEMNRRIDRLRATQRAGAAGTGLTRRGVNPVRQTIETERVQLEAQLAALVSREMALDDQLAAMRERQVRLQQLASAFARLERERAAMETTVTSLAEREEAARTRRADTLRENDNIRVVQRASPPTRAASLRRPAFALVLLVAALSGFFAAFARAAVSKAAPSRDSAERTLGLPVLAVVRAAA